MFKLQPNPTFIAKAALSVPGQAAPASIDVEYKHLSRPQLKAFYGGLADKTDAEALSEIMVGWKGPDAPFSQESLETLLDNYPASGGELFAAFRQNLQESRVKN